MKISVFWVEYALLLINIFKLFNFQKLFLKITKQKTLIFLRERLKNILNLQKNKFSKVTFLFRKK